MEDYFSSHKNPLKIVISDLSGDRKYHGKINKNGLHLDLKHLKTGIYAVRVLGKDFDQMVRLQIE